MLEDFFLVLALVVDAFAACFACGTEHIRISRKAAWVISAVGTGIFLLAMLAAVPLREILPQKFCTHIGNGLLLLIGLLSVFQHSLKMLLRRKKNSRRGLHFRWAGISFAVTIYLDETQADADRSKNLSLREAFMLGTVLSLDSFGIGFSSGFLQHHYIFIALSSLLLHDLAIRFACLCGKYAAGKLPAGCSSVGGIILILLALTRWAA